ncbi:hypothetical protein [Spirosoma sp. KNUC1025]|uniref:hypothetical protein n=1 Tax=Spirosoma sp. KNUC1025 TaxID=2894082 RepID=UPI003866AE6D|nr:hypothetical protein LN737_09635 [Spirosoma sp. KNUC1025]
MKSNVTLNHCALITLFVVWLVGCHRSSPGLRSSDNRASAYKTATDDSTLAGETSPF